MDNFVWGTLFGVLITMLGILILGIGIAWGREAEKKGKK